MKKIDTFDIITTASAVVLAVMCLATFICLMKAIEEGNHKENLCRYSYVDTFGNKGVADKCYVGRFGGIICESSNTTLNVEKFTEICE